MNTALFTTQDEVNENARLTSGRLSSHATALQTRYENAYSDPVYNAYLRTHPRALARRQHATDGMAARQLAHACGLPTGYAVAITDSGRLVRCYGAAMKVYWER